MNSDSTNENKKSKKNSGCFKWFGIAILVLLFFYAIGKCSGETKVSTSNKVEKNTDSTNVEKTIKVDSLKAKQLSKLFNEKKDKFEETVWISPKSKPEYLSQNGFYCYFAKEGKNVGNFRFVGQYYANDWLFVKKVIFNIDGKNYEYFPKKMDRDNAAGSIWEWFDDSVEIKDIELIKAIANSKSISVRWEGKTYNNDKNMSATNIKSIKTTLEYYKSLGGEF